MSCHAVHHEADTLLWVQVIENRLVSLRCATAGAAGSALPGPPLTLALGPRGLRGSASLAICSAENSEEFDIGKDCDFDVIADLHFWHCAIKTDKGFVVVVYGDGDESGM